MHGIPLEVATCQGGGLPCGLVLPACDGAQQEGVATGRGSALVPAALLLRATNSVYQRLRPGTSIVSQLLRRMMPLLQVTVG